VASASVAVVVEMFEAVERRDTKRGVEISHENLELHWPPSLPYGGSIYWLRASAEHRPSWSETWDPFQGEAERSLSPRVVAASEQEVVVLWRQRGRDAVGAVLDMPVLGLYEVREGKFARAQMFYFDTVGVVEFLARANACARA
jgi:uncharacterized protein